jgi:hypothetical protein
MSSLAMKMSARALSKRKRAIQKAAADHYANLYGPLLPYVQILRRRGFVVTAEASGFRVGNKVLNHHSLIAMARREQRLGGMQ